MPKIHEFLLNDTPHRPICLTLNKISVNEQTAMKLYQRNQEFYTAITTNNKALYTNKVSKENTELIGVRNKKKNTLRIFAIDTATLKKEDFKDTNYSTLFSPGCLAPLDMKTGIVYSVNCLIPQELLDAIPINPQVNLISFTQNLLASTTITNDLKKLRFQKLVYYLNHLIQFANNLEDLTNETILCPHSPEINDYFIKTFTFVVSKRRKCNPGHYQKLFANIILLALILGDFKVDLDKLLDLLPMRKCMPLTKKGILQSFKFQSRGSYAIELKYPLRTVFNKLTYCTSSK